MQVPCRNVWVYSSKLPTWVSQLQVQTKPNKGAGKLYIQYLRLLHL